MTDRMSFSDKLNAPLHTKWVTLEMLFQADLLTNT